MSSMTMRDFNRKKALSLLGLIESGQDPRIRAERLTFVNNINEIIKDRIQEYNIWYRGDSDELLNFYTRANTIDFNTDPLYNRNKKSYFWAVSSTEGDIKRTHSGHPRHIVDTLVNIIGIPDYGVGKPYSVLDKVDSRLHEILEDNDFSRVLVQKARPLTFVEGWGAWKINWDTSFSSTPILLYYRADAVDFVYKSNRLIAIIYKDYYQDEKGKNYVLYETRRLSKMNCTIQNSVHFGQSVPCLIIEKELFEITGQSEIIKKIKLSDLPQLKDVAEKIVIQDFNRFLGYPCIYFEDSSEDCYGRSIFAGKLDIFDDLDQCHSQAANSVRRSTATEVWDVNYLEKDAHTGMPIMPHSYDRKYVSFRGARNGDGTVGSMPVQITQPQIDFVQYSGEETNLLLTAINGTLSPATLGIDIAKKDNAEAQREKEKVSIFTRNTIIAEEEPMLRVLFNDLLVADELMRTGETTTTKYDVFVRYDEFADSSWEAKLETISSGWQVGLISDDMAVDMLYKDSVSPEIKKRELDFLKTNRAKEEQGGQGGDMDDMASVLGGQEPSPEELGMYGELGAENDYNDDHTKMELDGKLDEKDI